MVKKNFNKYKVYILYLFVFISLFVLSYFFPVSGNDYYLYEENIIARLDLFQFGYIGDYLSIIMVNNSLLRAFIVSVTIFIMSLMVGRTINEDDENIPILFMILLSFINSNILLRTIVNVSGFATYFFPLMLLSVYLYFVKKLFVNNKYNIYQWLAIILLSFIIGLFNDYISIFMIFSNIYVFIYMIVKIKKFDIKLFLLFFVSIISLILMFSSNDLLYGSKHVFDLEKSNVGFITNGIRNYFNIIQNKFLTENFILNVIISTLLLFLVNKNLKNLKYKNIIKLLSSFLVFFNSLIIVINLFDFNVMYGKIHYLISILSFLYIVSLFILIFLLIKKKEFNRFSYLFLILFLNIGFYSISYNLLDTAIIYLYFIYIFIILEIIIYLRNKINISFSIGIVNLSLIFITFIGSLIYIYSDIYEYNSNRNNIMYNSFKQGKEVLYVPVDGYSKYVFYNYPVSEKMETSFLKFLNINPEKVKLEFIEISSAKYKLEFEQKFKYDNLMIVAHPDDELIWGGKELMDEDYVVVCVTCGDNIDPIRVKEFSNVMVSLNDEYIMLGHEDLKNGRKSDWEMEYNFILKDINEIIDYKNWNKIVVHSPFGESGHIHHKLLNKITTSVVEDKSKLYYFGKYYYDESDYPEGTVKISDEYVKEKDRLFKMYYKSQSHVKFEMFYPYERLYSYKEWHLEYDPKYEYN